MDHSDTSQSKNSKNIDDIVNRLLEDARLLVDHKRDVAELANHISKLNVSALEINFLS